MGAATRADTKPSATAGSTALQPPEPTTCPTNMPTTTTSAVRRTDPSFSRHIANSAKAQLRAIERMHSAIVASAGLHADVAAANSGASTASNTRHAADTARTSSARGQARATTPMAKNDAAPTAVAISRARPKYSATLEYTTAFKIPPESVNAASESAHAAAYSQPAFSVPSNLFGNATPSPSLSAISRRLLYINAPMLTKRHPAPSSSGILLDVTPMGCFG